MAAGLGFKDFVTGEVLTAADVDGYLMQGIWVFASAAARDSAVTSPQEGNFAYLKDTNTTTYYTGSAWTNLDTTGMVNPMTTTGDTIYSSSGSTPARLGIGSTGQVLTVSGGVPSWATPSSGSMTSLASGSLSGTTVSLTSISGTYKDLRLIVKNMYFGSNSNLRIAPNGAQNNSYYQVTVGTTSTTSIVTEANTAGTSMNTNNNAFFTTNGAENILVFDIYDYANTVTNKIFRSVCQYKNNVSGNRAELNVVDGSFLSASAITSIDIVGTSTFSGGTYELFGVK